MNTFIQLAINVPSIAGVFDYSVPDHLAGRVGVGHLVLHRLEIKQFKVL